MYAGTTVRPRQVKQPPACCVLDPSMMCSNDLSGKQPVYQHTVKYPGGLYEFSMPSGKNEITHHLNIVSYFPFRVSHPFLWSVQIYISKNFQNKEKALKRPFQPSHKSAVSWRFQIFSHTNPFYLNRGLKRQTERIFFLLTII